MINLSLFVETLQDLMHEKNIKPIDIHNATNISLAAIYGWLKKTSIPSLKSLLILSDYFQCSIEFLTRRTNENNYKIPIEQQTFANVLRALLKRNKVSVRKLSAKTGIAKSAISYFLNGSIEPLLDNLIKLADFFECSLDYLVGREG